MSVQKHISLYILLSFMMIGCTKEQDLYKDKVYHISYPEYIPAPQSKQTLSEQKVQLGKQLFFDKNLSSNKKVSCATCHKEAIAFSDNTPLSPKGVPETALHRNSPPLFNLAWHNNFFWDGGASNLRSQALAPLIAPNEMNANTEDIIAYLRNNTSYKKQFNNIYKAVPSISFLLDALAEYEFSITSFQSKYDDVKLGKTQFSENEKKGYQLYLTHCASCHTEGLFSDYSFHNNGIDTNLNFSSIEDEKRGRNRITLQDTDLQKYKTASLRNLKHTAPYMHDGRFNTLEEVLNQYSHNVKNSSTISDKIPTKGFKFTNSETTNIIAFLNTLNDTKSFNK